MLIEKESGGELPEGQCRFRLLSLDLILLHCRAYGSSAANIDVLL